MNTVGKFRSGQQSTEGERVEIDCDCHLEVADSEEDGGSGR